MANGLLTFVFTTTVPVVPTTSYLNQDGSLTGIGLDWMYRFHKLSRRSYLQLHVWDVDHDAPDCAEVDVVYINGNRIEQNGSPATLRSGNGVWETWGVFFPTSFLRFPLTPYISPISFQPALNVVNIEVNTQQCETNDWKVEVDWGAVSVRPSLNYALFFVHGWTGNSGGFSDFDELAQQDGYLSFISRRLQEGVLPLEESTQLLMQEISDTTAYSGTDKVFVVAHSRGGLFTRAALREFPSLASKIAGYITLSTPHHGADAADNAFSNNWIPFLNRCRSVSDAEACKAAARSLRKEKVREFNYGEDCHEEWQWWPPGYVWVDCSSKWSEAESVNAYTIVGRLFDVDGESATFPWRADRIPFPNTANVNRAFAANHLNIVEIDDVYEYIINVFDSRKESDSGQAGAADVQIDAPDAQLLTPPITGTLTAGQMQSVTAPVEAVTTAAFSVMSDGPISVTLMTPTGQIIDPDTPSVDPQVQYYVMTPGTVSICTRDRATDLRPSRAAKVDEPKPPNGVDLRPSRAAFLRPWCTTDCLHAGLHSVTPPGPLLTGPPS